jgi:hypothetical protein
MSGSAIIASMSAMGFVVSQPSSSLPSPKKSQTAAR